MELPVIFLVDPDVAAAEVVVSHLSTQGWWVSVVPDGDAALRAAAAHAPNLVIVHRRAERFEGVIDAFARSSGGPGVILFEIEPDADLPAGADALLPGEFSGPDLVAAARRLIRESHAEEGIPAAVAPLEPIPEPIPEPSARKLTSTDIFGDMLDAPVAAEPDSGVVELTRVPTPLDGGAGSVTARVHFTGNVAGPTLDVRPEYAGGVALADLADPVEAEAPVEAQAAAEVESAAVEEIAPSAAPSDEVTEALLAGAAQEAVDVGDVETRVSEAEEPFVLDLTTAGSTTGESSVLEIAEGDDAPQKLETEAEPGVAHVEEVEPRAAELQEAVAAELSHEEPPSEPSALEDGTETGGTEQIRSTLDGEPESAEPEIARESRGFEERVAELSGAELSQAELPVAEFSDIERLDGELEGGDLEGLAPEAVATEGGALFEATLEDTAPEGSPTTEDALPEIAFPTEIDPARELVVDLSGPSSDFSRSRELGESPIEESELVPAAEVESAEAGGAPVDETSAESVEGAAEVVVSGLTGGGLETDAAPFEAEVDAEIAVDDSVETHEEALDATEAAAALPTVIDGAPSTLDTLQAVPSDADASLDDEASESSDAARFAAFLDTLPEDEVFDPRTATETEPEVEAGALWFDPDAAPAESERSADARDERVEEEDPAEDLAQLEAILEYDSDGREGTQEPATPPSARVWKDVLAGAPITEEPITEEPIAEEPLTEPATPDADVSVEPPDDEPPLTASDFEAFAAAADEGAMESADDAVEVAEDEPGIVGESFVSADPAPTTELEAGDEAELEEEALARGGSSVPAWLETGEADGEAEDPLDPDASIELAAEIEERATEAPDEPGPAEAIGTEAIGIEAIGTGTLELGAPEVEAPEVEASEVEATALQAPEAESERAEIEPTVDRLDDDADAVELAVDETDDADEPDADPALMTESSVVDLQAIDESLSDSSDVREDDGFSMVYAGGSGAADAASDLEIEASETPEITTAVAASSLEGMTPVEEPAFAAETDSFAMDSGQSSSASSSAPWLWIAAALVLALAGGWFWMQSRGASGSDVTPAPREAAAERGTAPTEGETAEVADETSGGSVDPIETTGPAAATASEVDAEADLDQIIEEEFGEREREIRERFEVERRRLEEQLEALRQQRLSESASGSTAGGR